MDEFKSKFDLIFQKLGFNLLLLAKVVLIIVAAFLLERILFFMVRRAYKRSDRGREDATRYKFLKNAVRFVVALIALGAIIYTIPSVRSVALTLFAGAGILVAILGLATQRAFSNIISGIFIVSFKPFRVGDQIRIGEKHSGFVEDITLRHTVIVNSENRRIIVPNAVISDEVIVNSSIVDESICQHIDVSVSYESDLDKAMIVLEQEAEAHPSSMDRRTADELERGVAKVVVRVVSLGESGVALRAYVWASDSTAAGAMHHDLNRSIKLRFDREGITIPYPHRTIVQQQTPRA